MCGICGVIYAQRDHEVERSSLEAMNRQIVHRGPDEDGFYVCRNIGLAMRRLSIIDLKTGRQPVSNEDETVWIVFNGEIYNHQELRRQLEPRGHRYRSCSDTETIVHLYEEYGRECVQHLRGMFAFAIWDARRRSLFVARDRLGIKPFYYRRTAESFLFGSEIKAILAHPGVRAEFNRGCPAGVSRFRLPFRTSDILCRHREAAPRPHSRIKRGRGTPHRFLLGPRPDPRAGSRPRSYYLRNYRDLLEETVSSHLMSDVPLGMFLSGGLDSSVVAALMTKLRREPIETFSVGYEEAPYSELGYAREIAQHIRSQHHEVKLGRQAFFAALPKLIWHEDDPSSGPRAWLSILWPSWRGSGSPWC